LKPKTSFTVVETRGRDAARPMARKQLLITHEPVVLVVDSDTTDDRRTKVQRRELEEYLAWGAADTPFKVLQFVPELEVVFFDSPSVLRSLVGKSVDKHAEAAGKLAPRKVLAMLVPDRDRLALIDKLRPTDVKELRKHPVIVDLRSFVGSPLSARRAG
jgi:hypothetical protein